MTSVFTLGNALQASALVLAHENEFELLDAEATQYIRDNDHLVRWHRDNVLDQLVDAGEIGPIGLHLITNIRYQGVRPANVFNIVINRVNNHHWDLVNVGQRRYFLQLAKRLIDSANEDVLAHILLNEHRE